MYVIVDIDGTVSEVGDRLKYLKKEPKDYDSFYEACFNDKPIESVIKLVEVMCLTHKIVFCTGRRDSVREITEKWIKENIKCNFKLLMRKSNDFRHDIVVKPELLLKSGITPENTLFVLEDRNSVVKKLREIGFKVFQVAEGSF